MKKFNIKFDSAKTFRNGERGIPISAVNIQAKIIEQGSSLAFKSAQA